MKAGAVVQTARISSRGRMASLSGVVDILKSANGARCASYRSY